MKASILNNFSLGGEPIRLTTVMFYASITYTNYLEVATKNPSLNFRSMNIVPFAESRVSTFSSSKLYLIKFPCFVAPIVKSFPCGEKTIYRVLQ